MVWALGIDIQNGQLVTELLRADGGTEYGRLEDLAAIGTPPLSRTARKDGVVTSFSTWKLGDTNEYLDAFGIILPETVTSRHQVFEFTVRATRFLVPALALMRTLFRPTGHILQTMFQAQALDQVCFSDYTSTPPLITVDAFWSKPGYRCMNQGIKDALSWMSSFPSASKMAGSVHEEALRGRLNLALPVGEARLSVHGLKKGNTLFANDVLLQRVITSESPFSCAEGHPQQIIFEEPSSYSIARNTDIPVFPNGTVTLSDAEWEVVGPILLAGAAPERQKLNQRHIFDGVITKLSLGIPWRKVPYKVGAWNNASHAYRNWLQKGTFHKAIDALVELRGIR